MITANNDTKGNAVMKYVEKHGWEYISMLPKKRTGKNTISSFKISLASGKLSMKGLVCK